jgi:hypothetical protein
MISTTLTLSGRNKLLSDWVRSGQLNSTSTPNQTDARDAMIARLEEANARAYEQFASKVARADKPLSDPLHEAADHPSDDLQTPFNTFRPAVAGDRPSHGTPMRRFFGLLLAAFIGVAALIWALSYGDAVEQLIAGWASQSAPSSYQTLAKQEFPAQTSSPNVQVDGAKVPHPRTGPQAQTVPEDVAPITAVQAGELAQWRQTMARDLATVRQGLEQLEASHEQMARDNAKIAEQFKANQEQAARDHAKIAEQLEASREQMALVIAKVSKRNLRPKTSAPPPPPVR